MQQAAVPHLAIPCSEWIPWSKTFQGTQVYNWKAIFFVTVQELQLSSFIKPKYV